jgi:hypothetical protein
MSRSLPAVVALTLGLVVWSASNANAQEMASWPGTIAIAPTTSAFAGAPAPVLSAEQIQRALPQPIFRRNRPSTLMTSLYASTAVMQALDVHSTLSAFGAGATEANPLMQGVTKNRAMFMAVKAGVAMSTIFAAKQLSKRNKVAAVATLVAINSAYAMVVSHNYKVARGVK